MFSSDLLRDPAIVFTCAIIVSALTVLILVALWPIREEKPTEEKHIWKCTAYYGGGSMVTPTEMTELEAVKWIASNNCIVGHVDRLNHFIFYKIRT